MPINPHTQAYIHSIESMGAVDGPGLRFVVFFQGCPLRCQYCHNPDTLPYGDGTLWNLQDLLDEVHSYVGFLQRSGGGVTVSGGEPLMQPEFVEAFLAGCKQMGLHTAMDTAGSLGHHATDRLLELTDLFLLDVKSGLPETYRTVTSGRFDRQVDFSRRLSAAGRPIWARFVLVPGLTDAPDNVTAVADLIAELETVERVEVLPYHKLGDFKWETLGLTNLLEATPACSEAEADRVRDVFRSRGLPNVV